MAGFRICLSGFNLNSCFFLVSIYHSLCALLYSIDGSVLLGISPFFINLHLVIYIFLIGVYYESHVVFNNAEFAPQVVQAAQN